ncbi:hypothetical protein ACN47E_007054 [Coniothyrium glycines]
MQHRRSLTHLTRQQQPQSANTHPPTLVAGCCLAPPRARRDLSVLQPAASSSRANRDSPPHHLATLAP